MIILLHMYELGSMLPRVTQDKACRVDMPLLSPRCKSGGFTQRRRPSVCLMVRSSVCRLQHRAAAVTRAGLTDHGCP